MIMIIHIAGDWKFQDQRIFFKNSQMQQIFELVNQQVIFQSLKNFVTAIQRMDFRRVWEILLVLVQSNFCRKH